MGKTDDFKQHITDGYTFKGDSLIIGAAMLDGKPIEGAQVKIPLKTLNRHGFNCWCNWKLVKLKTLQVLAEQNGHERYSNFIDGY